MLKKDVSVYNGAERGAVVGQCPKGNNACRSETESTENNAKNEYNFVTRVSQLHQTALRHCPISQLIAEDWRGLKRTTKAETADSEAK